MAFRGVIIALQRCHAVAVSAVGINHQAASAACSIGVLGAVDRCYLARDDLPHVSIWIVGAPSMPSIQLRHLSGSATNRKQEESKSAETGSIIRQRVAPDIIAREKETRDSSPDGDPSSAARSSEVTSAMPLKDESLLGIVQECLTVCEAPRDRQTVEEIISKRYTPDSVYINNAAMFNGLSDIRKGVAFLAQACEDAQVTYLPPVLLGATTSAPDMLADYATKPTKQIEIQATHKYQLRGDNTLVQRLGVPKKLEMPVLTRLTLDAGGTHIVRHEDEWLDKPQLPDALKRAVGKMVTGTATLTGA